MFIKRVIIFSLLFLLFNPVGLIGQNKWMPDSGAWVESKGWRYGSFRSKIAGCEVGYYIYLPPGYDTATREKYPVVYWLHGINGAPASANLVIIRLDSTIKKGVTLPFILVSCTDPTKRSMWTDSKDGENPVESVIIKELIPHIDLKYRTINEREGRGVEGYSMGGFGAAYLGFKYPGLFGSVSILSGALHTPESLLETRREIYDFVYSGDEAYAKVNSPWYYIRRNAESIRGKTCIRIHVGDHDQLINRYISFKEVMDSMNISYESSVIPNSTHDPSQVFKNWKGNMFEYYNNAFAKFKN